MDRWSGKVALVTGASVGIGAAVCYKLVQYGINVVGCARNIEQLNKIGEEIAASKVSGKFTALKCDLRNESEILGVFSSISSQFGRLDILINNAGLANSAPLISGSSDAWREMIDVNVLALSICTHEAVQQMIANSVSEAQIINISSMSGHRVVDSAATHFYSATKYAVRALTEGLRQELRQLNSGIRVSQISPGLTETEFAPRLFHDQKKAAEMYSGIKALQADDIAQVVVNTLALPSHVEIHDVLIRPTQQKL